MDELSFIELCRKRIAKYYGIDDYKTKDIYVVWLCRIIQNSKALLSTNRQDGLYFECTYNGDKRELYLDVYKRKDHFVSQI